jgi:predicted dehydrogenase
MDDPVRVAVVGLGWWGNELADSAERSKTGTVVRCYARSEAARREFADTRGCREAETLEAVLDDDNVEAVLVATPHRTHREIVVAAAEAGKHVLVEKPFTLTVADGYAAAEAAEKAGVVLQVGHFRRKTSALRALRMLVDEGELGQLHLLEGHFSLPTSLDPKPGWREDREERPLGGMTPLGVHVVDNLRYLGGRIVSVNCESRRLLGRSNLDDVTTCGIQFESGALGYLRTSLVVPNVNSVAVFGTAGAAWSEQDGRQFFRQRIDEKERSEIQVEKKDALADQFADFASAIRRGTVPEVTGADAIEVVAVLEAARLSADEHRTVALSEVGWKGIDV